MNAQNKTNTINSKREKTAWLRTSFLPFALVILSMVFGVSAAKADVTGTWKGPGEWTHQGKGTGCLRMLMQYEESPTALKRLRGFFDCGVVALHSDPREWSRQGSDLFFDGQKAGTITDRGFEATEPYDNGVSITTKFSIDSAGHADYLETWTDDKGREIYVIRGRFARRN